jgi:hypothetical protein
LIRRRPAPLPTEARASSRSGCAGLEHREGWSAPTGERTAIRESSPVSKFCLSESGRSRPHRGSSVPDVLKTDAPDKPATCRCQANGVRPLPTKPAPVNGRLRSRLDCGQSDFDALGNVLKLYPNNLPICGDAGYVSHDTARKSFGVLHDRQRCAELRVPRRLARFHTRAPSTNPSKEMRLRPQRLQALALPAS